MVHQDRYIVALSYQLTHTFILLYWYAASCGERPSFDSIKMILCKPNVTIASSAPNKTFRNNSGIKGC